MPTNDSWPTVGQTTNHIERVLRQMSEMSVTDLANRLQMPANTVRNTLVRMKDAGRVNFENRGRHTVWMLAKKQAEARPPCVNRMTGTYDGRELRRNPGISAARFEAFDLPSRWGKQLRFPNGHVEAV